MTTIKTAADERVGAKFNVTQVTLMADGKRTVKMAPVTDINKNDNNALWTGAAKGKAEITVTNNEYNEFFKPGRSYEVLFREIPIEADPEEQPGGKSAKALGAASTK